MASNQPPGTFRFILRLLIVYFLDWVVILGTVAFAGSTSLWAVPNTRPFSTSDISISFPFQEHTKIPTYLLVLLAVIIPGILIFLLTVFSTSPTAGNWRSRLYSLNTALLGLGLSIAIGMLITDGLKNLCGRPRPDLLSRCAVDPAKVTESTIGPERLLDWSVCSSREIAGQKGTGSILNEGDLRDGFRSFPSGHASMSFAGLVYFAIFMAEYVFRIPLPHLSSQPLSAPIVEGDTRSGTTTPRRSRSKRTNNTPTGAGTRLLPRYPIMLALLICGVPILLAIYIASTRYSDYRHHPSDIFGGAILGTVAATAAWRFYGAWCVAIQVGMYGADVERRKRSMRGGEGLEIDTEEDGIEMEWVQEGSRSGEGTGAEGRGERRERKEKKKSQRGDRKNVGGTEMV